MVTPTLELREAVVFLAAAGLVVPAVHWLRVSPVLGFLLVGIVIGPFGLGRFAEDLPWLAAVTIHDTALARLAGELGVIFLLFMIGLELSLERLAAMRRMVFGLGSAQVLGTAGAIGLIALMWGNAPANALLLGACLALSSTAIVMQLLTESGRLGTPVGQAAFAVLLLQDLAVVPILLMIGMAGETEPGGGLLLLGAALAVGKAAVAIAVILVAGRVVVRPALRLVAATESRELFLAVVLLAVIGTAAATEAAGLSLALGAFLAGLLLAETEFRHRIAVDLEPFKGLLLGVFFVAVGLGIDVAAVLHQPVLVPLSAVGLILVKAGLLYPMARLAGLPRAVAAETALLLGQGGEFAFIVINMAVAAALMSMPVAQFMLLVVGLSMALTPLTALAARRLGAWLTPATAAAQVAVSVPGDLAGHVVIVGYGRVGRAIGKLLDGQGVPHVAIERRPGRVARLRAEGAAVFHGDAGQIEILERLGLGRAAALAVTMDDAAAVRRLVEAVHRTWPDLHILARVHDEAHAQELLAAGADHVTPETTEASLQLGEAVLVALGIPEEAARRLVDEEREAARERLYHGGIARAA